MTDFATKPDIYVELKTNYGKQTIYPYCESAKSFCSLLGQTTLTEQDIQHIKSLGYDIHVVQKVKEL
jgi:hypothetical protein